MNYPEYCYSKTYDNNAIIIKWGQKGYYKTDFPKGKYTEDIINKINSQRGITSSERKAMELCSIAAQNNPNLNWEEHYEKVKKILEKNK